MTRTWIIAGIASLTLAISSCNEDTTTLGSSLTERGNQFTIVTDTFDVSTRSIAADYVLTRSAYTYLGCIKDPETGASITSNFSTQFNILESEVSKLFPSKDLMTLDGSGQPVADSCFIWIVANSYQGDSLTAMKLKVMELNAPITDKGYNYSNFDLESKGYIRTAAGSINKSKLFTMSDLTRSDSLRNAIQTDDTSLPFIQIPINEAYTDKAGTTYNNYGTYIIRKYYENPDNFKNFNTFRRNVCPGMFFKLIDGQGLMVEVGYTRLLVCYHYQKDGKKVDAIKLFDSTEEVLQTTQILNDQLRINQLVNEDTCTFLKTPAGIYTEVTLPVEQIKNNHENDTITSAKIVFNRMRALNNLSEVVLEEPTNLLLIERDSLYSFFENNGVPDNISGYLATFNSSLKSYSFNNIAALINKMYKKRGQSANWNKAVLIPVQVTTTSSTSSSSSTAVAGVTNEMNVNSVRLVGGAKNKHTPIKISVIYNKNR